ncbi:(2Fe-2S)-binding protein [Polaribacter tangerinus]|uniref:(2Fe-2S)-binding protein n=1 Tax=Polaribacter tangerinus TaxID=1920034 RepID=UPI000B4B4539|nr:(2Fe-2S)-binding protein [Polaribacter tangerinus]
MNTILKINGKTYTVQAASEMPLLWTIRDIIGLTGTKFGCGVGQCGACSVLIDGKLSKSCSVTTSFASEKEIITIEGTLDNLELLRKAWQEANVPQCGFCQSGQLIAATSLLNNIKNPSDEDIDDVMSANICRCGTYSRIKKAIKMVAEPKKDTP